MLYELIFDSSSSKTSSVRLLLDSQHCLDNIDNVDNLDNQNANILEEGFCTEIILE